MINIEIINDNYDCMCVIDLIKMIDNLSVKKIIKYKYIFIVKMGYFSFCEYEDMQRIISKYGELVYFILKYLNFLIIQIILRNKYYI